MDETYAIYSPKYGLVYFNIENTPIIDAKEEVTIILEEEATAQIANLAILCLINPDTVEITDTELVYCLDPLEPWLGSDVSYTASPYWKISVRPKDSARDWLRFADHNGLLREDEAEASDAYFLINAVNGNPEYIYDRSNVWREKAEELGITPKTEKFKIDSVSVIEQTASSYTVQVTFTAPAGIKEVSMPTWTSANGQDDLVFHTAKINGNTAACIINISDHNNEKGTYITKVQVWGANNIIEMEEITAVIK